ncbi:hypothetical protein OIU79_021056 [Salix purpurea]|uniref:Uncharacterized protein n=1 Tax=Salix purpurea TaxID=77065 RepID=A0A9Q0WNG9_SALPP|nr:hypothetical protein OIU79_021056 [Salix purpurea]
MEEFGAFRIFGEKQLLIGSDTFTELTWPPIKGWQQLQLENGCRSRAGSSYSLKMAADQGLSAATVGTEFVYPRLLCLKGEAKF